MLRSLRFAAWIVLIGLPASGADAVAPPFAKPPDWENVALLGLHKEPPHASMVVCPDVGVAREIRWTANAERVKSPWYQSLNGPWRFHYGQTRHDRVPEFFKTEFDDASWPLIAVPGNNSSAVIKTPDRSRFICGLVNCILMTHS